MPPPVLVRATGPTPSVRLPLISVVLVPPTVSVTGPALPPLVMPPANFSVVPAALLSKVNASVYPPLPLSTLLSTTLALNNWFWVTPAFTVIVPAGSGSPVMSSLSVWLPTAPPPMV